MADTRCKVCNSPNRAVIEEQSSNGIPARVVSHFVKVNFDEDISYVAIQAHLNKHMGKIENDKTATLTRDPEDGAGDLLKEIEGLKNRVHSLEVVAWWNASTVSYTGWNSYTLKGKTPHELTYRNIVEEAMPETENLEAQYMGLVASIKARRVAEDGEDLTDAKWKPLRDKQRKESIVDTKEKLAEATRDLEQRAHEQRAFRDGLERLVEQEKRAARVAT
jgi:hypothetical protein